MLYNCMVQMQSHPSGGEQDEKRGVLVNDEDAHRWSNKVSLGNGACCLSM